MVTSRCRTKADMVVTAAATLPLWASIVLALAAPGVAVIALIVGKQQQAATLRHQAKQHAATLQNERLRDDLGEARGVLDDAARALHDADHKRRAIIGDLDNDAKREALRVAGHRLDEIEQRIGIRFGRGHIVTISFGACAEAMLNVFGATQYPELFDLADRTDRLRTAGREFEALWPAFIDAATAYAGVDLEQRP
jgi:hypothetical protein